MAISSTTAPDNSVSTVRDTRPPIGRWRNSIAGVAVGLTAAVSGLASAEVVAALRSDLQSPVLDVGDRVVDSVPSSVKNLAIEWFGTNDKIALLVGIGSMLAVYAAMVGVLALGRRWRLAIIGIALFGVVGAYASQTTRRSAPWFAISPSLVGGAVAAVVLLALRYQLTTRAQTDRDGVTEQTPDATPSRDTSARAAGPVVPLIANLDADTTQIVDRRRFIAATAATAAGAAAVGLTARTIGNRSGVGAQRNELGLPIAPNQLAVAPAAVSADGAVPFFTPNADFYRIDTALTVPQVSVNSWKLEIDGMVDTPFSLTYDELLSREIVESDITLTCVSNEVGGTLMGTARWLGVRLDDLLAEAGIDPAADQIVGRSVDGYTAGFPVSALDGRDALVAIGMNDEPLPLEHGYPARLIVPGLYGYVSATKWLTNIELTRFDQFDHYWVERGYATEAPIKVGSRIDTPRGLSKVPSGVTAVAGVAWAQTRGIDKVELQIDDGEWFEAELADELNDVTWRQWSYAWDAPVGRHSIRVRATERGGAVQTEERVAPLPDGATGRHQVIVIVE